MHGTRRIFMSRQQYLLQPLVHYCPYLPVSRDNWATFQLDQLNPGRSGLVWSMHLTGECPRRLMINWHVRGIWCPIESFFHILLSITCKWPSHTESTGRQIIINEPARRRDAATRPLSCCSCWCRLLLWDLHWRIKELSLGHHQINWWMQQWECKNKTESSTTDSHLLIS